ncbi:hypothetical protein NDU88_006619 [Pleurodeles waltl]|uniref:Uncharacterized protein n=1 Tax=Pleurodeles waltl TaxID=8319 RepID=A0AAV7N0Y6_PLEWA|nr:hypothetical protein NDU88_006619 [Pleurodeles waltl]
MVPKPHRKRHKNLTHRPDQEQAVRERPQAVEETSLLSANSFAVLSPRHPLDASSVATNSEASSEAMAHGPQVTPRIQSAVRLAPVPSGAVHVLKDVLHLKRNRRASEGPVLGVNLARRDAPLFKRASVWLRDDLYARVAVPTTALFDRVAKRIL